MKIVWMMCAMGVCQMALGQTSKPAWSHEEHGELILRAFAHAPYPHASREKGFTTKSGVVPKEGHYDDSTVAVFVPKNYVPRDAVDFVVFFHGHQNEMGKALRQFKLMEQVSAAKVNAILVVPQGPKNASDSGCGKLELDQSGMRALLEEVAACLHADRKIKSETIGKVVLSAHSGGYKVTAAVLDHGGLSKNITDVFLLDASYGSLEWFANWCAASKDHHLVSLFTAHLASANAELMGLLKKANVAHVRMEEAEVAPSTLALRRATFISTKLAHNEVPAKTEYLRRLLESSALSLPEESSP